MRAGAYAAWTVRDQDFPRAGSVEEQLAFLARYAILAPSAHNTQPWQFTIRGNHLQVAADESRALTVSDPTRRELFLSLGAAVANLLIAAEHFGFRATLEEFPPGESDVVADLALVADPSVRTSESARLFAAIPRRHANRNLFEARRVPTELLMKLRAQAASGDPRLDLVEDRAKIEALAAITGRAVAASMGQADFRAELSRWVRTNFTKRPDGMPGFVVGVPDVPSLLGPVVVKLPLTAKAEAKKRQAQVASSPLVAILSTRGDAKRDWLRAGMLLERVWLTATAERLRISVLAAAIETGEFSREVQKVLDIDVRPQAFCRIGYGPPDPHPTPRRPLGAVLRSPA